VSTTTIPKILYIDDDSDDCIFLRESFAASSITHTNLIWASGGEEAISYLHSIDHDALPSLIILDLNMPRWDGRQTLNYIKSDPELAAIPVVILSTSENNMDKEACKRLGAASYLQKPYHYEGYKDIVRNCMPLIKVSTR
jgi:CheY-like chemotaxis protein